MQNMHGKYNDMRDIILNEINFAGVRVQIPDSWRYKTEEFKDEDGTKSYGLTLSARGRDARSVNLSWGSMPEGTNAYTEACITYEQVVGEVDLTENNETMMSFGFHGHEAHGFNVCSESGLPCFFFCVELPCAGRKILLTVLACAANIEELEDLLDYMEEHILID